LRYNGRVNLTRKQFLTGAAATPFAMATNSVSAADATGLSAEVAAFVATTKYENLPSELIELSKKHILDALGLAVAGEKAESGPIVRRYLAEMAGHGASTVLGTTLAVKPRFAAFANGVAIHADDYDDTQLAVAKDRVYGLLTHPSVTALSAALAVGEPKHISGRELLLAYHLGVDVECKIAEASNPRAYETGFHSTGLFGVFGAAMSAGKLSGLDAKGLRISLGIAAAQASGIRENFGTMSKPFQAGHAAEGGVVAAELAALGWTAAENALEGPVGIFAAAAGGYDAGAIHGKLGNPWSFLSPGVSIKPHPSGSLSHPAMDEMDRLIKANHLTPAVVESIRIGTNKPTLTALIHHRPVTGLEAKFSLEYCLAVLLLDGKAGLAQFTDAAVNRPEAQALLRKVEAYNDPAADAAGADKMHSIITIKLKSGRVIEGSADFAKGSPQFPMSFDEVCEKFRDCIGYGGLSAQAGEAVIARVRKLESLDDISRLTVLLKRS
jgi:2-methylcitrate dehydratase PrpD